MNRLRVAAAGLAVCLAATSCAVNPVTGKRELVLMSEAQERAVGEENDRAISASLGLYPDPALQDWVQRVGSSLAERSERPGLDWTFRVVDDPVVNAFALPGGYIYVTRGILAHLDSEAEVAAVIGHEIGHVTARHGVSQMTKATLAQLGLGLGMVLSEDFAEMSGLAAAGLELLFLKYSRDDETQADDLGLGYLYRGGYDPRPMAQVYTVLERVGQAEGHEALPTYMLTHPRPENRRQRVEAGIAALPPGFEGRPVRRDEYLQRLDDVVFGEDPRQGYFEGREFLHPDLAFRMSFPQGWKGVNDRQAVFATSPEKDALLVLSLAQEASAAAALEAFAQQQGVTRGDPWRRRINGLTAASIGFSARAQSGALQGLAAFVEHGGAVYQLLAYAPTERWVAHRARLETALASFDKLTDPTALGVRPARLNIVRAKTSVSLADFAKQQGTTADLETLARINQLDAGAQVEAGQLYKVVVGGRPAASK